MALVLAIFLVRAASRRIRAWLKKRVLKWRRLQLKSADLRPSFASLAGNLVSLISFCLLLCLAGLWLAIVFHQFPSTRETGQRFTQHLKDMGGAVLQSLIDALPGLITVILIFALTKWLSGVLQRIIDGMARDEDSGFMSPDAARATRRLSIISLWLFSLVLAYPYMPGSGSEAFKGISLLLGLMVSLGSAGMINQIMSGFVLQKSLK